MKKISMLSGIRSCLKYGKLSKAEQEALQQERFKKMVCFARKNSPYYAALYQNVAEDFSLTDLPVVNKAELMENWNDWVTDRNVSLQEIH